MGEYFRVPRLLRCPSWLKMKEDKSFLERVLICLCRRSGTRLTCVDDDDTTTDSPRCASPTPALRLTFMSSALVNITVEHPQQTQRFEVYVFSTAIVRDVKEQIARVCPGNPEASGQRLICKGRILNDAEKVDSVWTVSDSILYV